GKRPLLRWAGRARSSLRSQLHVLGKRHLLRCDVWRGLRCSHDLDLNQAFVERSARWFLNLESAHEQTTRKPGRELAAVVIGIGERLSGVGRGGGTEASRLRLRGCFT